MNVTGPAGEAPCIDLDGSRVYAELGEDGVLTVRVCPAGDVPAAVYVNQDLVADSRAERQSAG
jgi:hypothetical protein